MEQTQPTTASASSSRSPLLEGVTTKCALGDIEFPTSFECTSGEIIYGHVQCLIEGVKATSRDVPRTIPHARTGGTIIQNDFQYRAAARKGTWKVAKVQKVSNNRDVAFVLYHSDENPQQWVRRAAAVSINHNRPGPDPDVVYVNRYDWGWHHGNDQDVQDFFGVDATSPIQSLKCFHLTVVDAAHALPFLKYLAEGDDIPVRRSVTIRDEQGQTVGVQLWDQLTEYELGWLCFNKENELVALVYDHTYSGLEFPLDVEFRVDPDPTPFTVAHPFYVAAAATTGSSD